jgi:hypothetical protein
LAGLTTSAFLAITAYTEQLRDQRALHSAERGSRVNMDTQVIALEAAAAPAA